MTLNIGLLGGSFCCPNFGVGALTISQCLILDNIAEHLGFKLDIVCYEAQINENSYLGAVKFRKLHIMLDTHTYNISIMRKKLSRHDIVIDMYGGDSFSDIYSVKGFVIGACQRIFSLSHKATFILAPQTIGPFRNKFAYHLATNVMRRADHIFIRDKDSLNIVKKVDKDKTISVTDMAFLLPYSKEKTDVFKVGLNVSGLLWNGTLLGDLREKYKSSIRGIIDYFAERGILTVLVPHVLNIEDNLDGDSIASNELKREFGNAVSIAPAFKNPVEAKNYISSCSIFIGSRMHATIAAVSSGVPTVAIAYSKKFSGVFNGLNYRFVVEKQNIDKDYILDQIDYIIKNYNLVSEQLMEVKNTAEGKLKKYEEYVQMIIREKAHESK